MVFAYGMNRANATSWVAETVHTASCSGSVDVLNECVHWLSA